MSAEIPQSFEAFMYILPADLVERLYICSVCLRFRAGIAILRTRRRAAIVIQRAWDLHVYGEMPDLIASVVFPHYQHGAWLNIAEEVD